MNRELDALKRRTHEAVLLERAKCSVLLRDLGPELEERGGNGVETVTRGPILTLDGKPLRQPEFDQDQRRQLHDYLEEDGVEISPYLKRLLLLYPDSDFGE